LENNGNLKQQGEGLLSSMELIDEVPENVRGMMDGTMNQGNFAKLAKEVDSKTDFLLGLEVNTMDKLESFVSPNQMEEGFKMLQTLDREEVLEQLAVDSPNLNLLAMGLCDNREDMYMYRSDDAMK
jgi:hypothetical protein